MENQAKERQAILSILGKALFDRELTAAPGADWNALLSESRAQTVLPLVFDAVKEQLPAEVRQTWMPVFLQTVASNIRVAAAHAELHRQLTAQRIPYVVLKGCASARYYPRPELRTMGDVDFLVPRQRVEECDALLIASGMQRQDEGHGGYHRGFTLHGIGYELHRSPPGVPSEGGEELREALRPMMEDASAIPVENGECRVPGAFHHGLVLLLHTAAHMTSTGIGLRHLCDWAVFVSPFSDADFAAQYEPLLKKTGLWEFARILTAMSTAFLGAPEKRWADGVDKALLDSMLEDIWTGGNFGTKDAQRQSYKVIMRDTRTRQIEKRSILHSFALAVRRKAKAYYPRLNRFRLLRPLAWFAVCWRYALRVLRGKRAPLKPGRDARIAMERRELFEQLRLFREE